MDIPNSNTFTINPRRDRERKGVYTSNPRMASLKEISEEKRRQWYGQPPTEVKPSEKTWRAEDLKF